MFLICSGQPAARSLQDPSEVSASLPAEAGRVDCCEHVSHKEMSF